MMKKIFYISIFATLLLAALYSCGLGQNKKFYDPEANVEEQLAQAKQEAQAGGKRILLQIGGDWCKWCVRFNNFVVKDKELHRELTDRFVWVHLFYGKDKKNEALMESLHNPQQFGFPVFVVLDAQGEYVQTLPTGELESGDSYDREAVLELLREWGE